MTQNATKGPLSGILVVDLSRILAGPYCTLLMAEMGARVIKVEPPKGGDDARAYGPFVNGKSTYFASVNRGKESIVLDLKATDDRRLIEAMLGKADVFVQNLVPGAAARMELGAAQLVRRFPRLIALDIVGYGQDTASGDLRAYDLLVQAESGLCSVTGSPDAPAKLARFRERDHLTIPLLSDPDRSVLTAWGAYGEKKLYGKTVEGVIRSTVVVDEEGTVSHAWYNVKATGHVAKLRRDLGLE